MKHSGRKKHSSLLVVLLREMKHSGRKKHSSLLGVLFSGADNQIRTGDLVLTKDVLYSKKRKCSKKIKTAENALYLVLFGRFLLFDHNSKINGSNVFFPLLLPFTTILDFSDRFGQFDSVFDGYYLAWLAE